MTALELEGIHLVRGGKTILRGIDWTVQRGDHWALLGANGSGKTTLLKVITGDEWPTRGEVRVLGERHGDCDLRELRRRIGWVSAALERRVHGGDTGWEIALSGFEASLGLYREFSEAECRQAERALRDINASQVADQPFETMSQGEQQRVLIARALIHRPTLLILDEPCAGLDPAAREDLLVDLQTLGKRRGGPTLILVTHHLEEIGPWVSHAMILRGGECLAQGRVGEVISAATLTRALGRPCRVTARGGRYRLSLG
ncbi:ABC transporter ATP-binding protein [Candidatus Sumerlaeota bacterium]|nr:ABC transporter ATP-binding protein [Candidatus Sumerlaeota bacterium]